jgi:guanylate kinase
MQLEMERQMSQQRETSPPSSRQGLLFVLSAPSGTGKDTVIKTARAQGMDFFVVPSVTTRQPRPGESEGNPYRFVSKEAFEELVGKGELLEYANVHGNWYGQPRQPIRDNLRAGRDVVLKIDVKGAATIRKKVPGAILIFLTPESLEELAARLAKRNTETEEELKRRLQDAHTELAEQDWYDYVITNRQGHAAEAAETLRAIMTAEHSRVHPRQVTI